MKDEELLKKLYEFRAVWDENASKAAHLLDEWIADTQLDIASNSVETIGFGDGAKVLKSWVTGNRKTHPEMAGIMKTSKRNKWVICYNGVLCVRTNSSLNLPEIDNQKSKADFLSKKIDEMAKKKLNPLSAPRRCEIDTTIKVQKAQKVKTPVFSFGEGKPTVDAKLLSDMMALFPTGAVSYEEGVATSPLYFRYENKEGLLCPIAKV